MKYIPLLVLVAMLAFSVRLVEVVGGTLALSGAVYAADTKKDSHKKEVMKDNHDKEMVKGGDKPGSDSMDVDKSGLKTPKKKKGAKVDWLDASDSDFAFTEVRMEVFEDMKKRRMDLEEREKEIGAREALLTAAEQELDRKSQELKQLRNKIESLLEKQSEAEQARVASLVKIYEGMKAKQAARIFDTLDLDVLVSVVDHMSERRLAPILANMNPERARTITIMLAEQKKLPDLPTGN